MPQASKASFESLSVTRTTRNDNARDDGSGSSSSTVYGAALNLTNSIVGAGCIGYGGAFAQSGGLPSLVTVLVFAALTKRSFDMIIAMGLQLTQRDHVLSASSSSSASSFEAIGRAAYGTVGLAAAVVSKGLFSFGCMVAYLVIVKENAAPALQKLSLCLKGPDEDVSFLLTTILANEGWLTTILATIFLLPLCLLRDISALENLSKLKIAAYGAIAAIVMFLWVQLRDGVNDHTDSSGRNDWLDHWFTVKPGLVPSTGTFVLSFVSQHTVHLVYLSLQQSDRNLTSFTKVSTFAIIISTVIILAVGLPVYLTFGDQASSDLFLLYPPSQSTIVNAARLFLSAGMILTFPMPLFSLRDSLVQLLPLMSGRMTSSVDQVALDPLETTSLLGNGRQVSNGDLQITGWWWKQQSFTLQAKQDSNGESTPTDASSLPSSLQDRQLITSIHALFTVTLWAASLVLALVAPSLGVVLNLVGCLSGAMLGFFLPGLFWAKLSEGGWTPMAVFMVVVGLVVSCLGTYYSVVDANKPDS